MSKDELHARFNKFGDGQWAELLDEALGSTTVNARILLVDSAERRAEAAERKVMLGRGFAGPPVPHRGSFGAWN